MRERRRVLAASSMTLFFAGIVWYNYSAVLPLIVEEWDLSGRQAGLIFGTFQAGYLVAILPAGWLVDRRSPRSVIAVGAFGTGLSSLAFAAFADGVFLGSVLRFVCGCFVAGVYVPGMRFITDWYPDTVRGRAIGIYVGVLGLGSGLSFVFVTVAAEIVSWRVAIASTSLGAIFVAPAVLAFTRDHPRREFGSARRIDVSLLKNREFLHAVSVYSWHNWELFGVRNWLLAFLVTLPAFAATDSTILPGLTVGAMIIAGGAGSLVGGWLSDRLGRLRTVGIGLATSVLLSATFGLLGGLPLPVLVGITIVYGFVLSMDSAPISTYVTEAVPDDRVGTALSIQSLAGFTPTVVSPVVFGVALDRAGYVFAFPTLAAGGAIGLVSVLALVRFRRR